MPKIRIKKVGSMDPGGQVNSFFFTLLGADVENKRILLLGGKSWKFQEGVVNYQTIENEITVINSNEKLDYLVCERNNTGKHVIDSLQNQFHVPVIGINTANKITNRRTLAKGETMDKPEQVRWLIQQKQNRKFLVPKNKTEGIKAVMSQLDNYSVERTPSGKITYKAPGNLPDDAVSALLIGTFFIRRKLFGEGGGGRHFVGTKKFGEKEISQAVDSHLPSDVAIIGRDVVYPTGQMYGKYTIH